MTAAAHVLWEMFRWPAGIVVGNLIASLLWAAPALLHLHRKLDRHHAERLAQAARHHQAVMGELRKQAPPPGNSGLSGSS